MVIQVQRARPVMLHADGQTRQLRTHAATVGELLAEAGVQLGPADEIWLGERLVASDTPLWRSGPARATVSSRGGPRPTAGARSQQRPPLITLRRATSLTLDDDGVTTTLHTTLDTVGQVLQEHGVSLFLGDEVTPGLAGAASTPGMTVTHRALGAGPDRGGRAHHPHPDPGRDRGRRAGPGGDRPGGQGPGRAGPGRACPARHDHPRDPRARGVRWSSSIPSPSRPIWVADPEVEIDNIRLVQEGQVGLTKRRYRVVYENGQEVERFLEDVWAEQPPITKTMAYGTKIVDPHAGDARRARSSTGARCASIPLPTSRPPAGKPKDHPRYGYTRLGW